MIRAAGMNTGRHRLPLFLFVSLAVHVAALLSLPDLPLPPAPQHGDTGLRVTLTRVSAGLQAHATRPATVSPAVSRPPPRADARPAPAVPAPRQTPPAATTATAPAEGTADESPAPDTATARVTRIAPGAALLAHLRAAMQPYFHYPLLARRRGWEGTVQIGLRINANGEISQLRIIETSRHAVLDQAALDCLSKIGRMPGAVVAWLNGHDSDIVLPVKYHLTDG